MLHVLTIVLVTLKAIGLITFDWIWVFAPSIFAVAMSLFFVAIGIAAVVVANKNS